MGNTSNTGNAHKRLHAVRVGGAVAMALLEAFVLLEILWYYLHDGEQTLHEAACEYAEHWKERAAKRAAVDETRDMIRNLPEKK